MRWGGLGGGGVSNLWARRLFQICCCGTSVNVKKKKKKFDFNLFLFNPVLASTASSPHVCSTGLLDECSHTTSSVLSYKLYLSCVLMRVCAKWVSRMLAALAEGVGPQRGLSWPWSVSRISGFCFVSDDDNNNNNESSCSRRGSFQSVHRVWFSFVDKTIWFVSIWKLQGVLFSLPSGTKCTFILFWEKTCF